MQLPFRVFLEGLRLRSLWPTLFLGGIGGSTNFIAGSVMPNHVHLLITPLENVSKVMQSLKRFTARECVIGSSALPGRRSGRTRAYDRLVRNETEFARIATYIEMNPVKCGLALSPRVSLVRRQADCQSGAGLQPASP